MCLLLKILGRSFLLYGWLLLHSFWCVLLLRGAKLDVSFGLGMLRWAFNTFCDWMWRRWEWRARNLTVKSLFSSISFIVKGGEDIYLQ